MSEHKLLCLLDVLGFENLLSREGLDNIKQKYEKLIGHVKEPRNGIDIAPTANGHVAVGWLIIGSDYFSDTVLFWTDFNEISLPSFTHQISEAICFSIEIKLPLRGTLSVGDLVLDSETRTYLGNPLVEAARTERNQQWIGVSFGTSFTTLDRKIGFHLDTVLPYKSHYKDRNMASATGMVVDWPRKWRETRKTDINKHIMELDVDPAYSEYYQRTRAFIDFSERNHEWYLRQSHLDHG